MLQVLLPKDARRQGGEEYMATAEQFLSALSGVSSSMLDHLAHRSPVIVFEIVALPEKGIAFFAGTDRSHIRHLEKQIYAHYPEADVVYAPEYEIFDPTDTVRIATLQLRKKSHMPIATYKELGADPAQQLTGALAKIQHTDSAIIQYVLTPAPKEKSQQRKEQSAHKPTARMQHRIALMESKKSQQQFSVNIRVGISVRKPDDADRAFEAITSAFSGYDFPDLNQLVAQEHQKNSDVMEQIRSRVPDPSHVSILSVTELASLYHFPSSATPTPNIVWREVKSAPAPTNIPAKGVLLGMNEYRGVKTPIRIDDADRRKHAYLVGQDGTGKMAMLLSMILQDISEGKGVGVIDPRGDLVTEILQRIPKNRLHDVVVCDPQDINHASLDVRDIMDSQKIFLCHLLRPELGSTLVSKIQIAESEMSDVSESERKDFYLYLNEFQDFVTDSGMVQILSGAGEHRLNVHLAHQSTAQLLEPLRNTVLENVGTIVCCRVGIEDAQLMEKKFSPIFSQYDLMHLRRFTAVVRPFVHGAPEHACSIVVSHNNAPETV